jgi:hypothetical protein
MHALRSFDELVALLEGSARWPSRLRHHAAADQTFKIRTPRRRTLTGTGAFPSVATLIRYTGLSERTVRTCLDRLDSEGIIRPCDPDIVAARISRAPPSG